MIKLCFDADLLLCRVRLARQEQVEALNRVIKIFIVHP
jgi:hypothetical protein